MAKIIFLIICITVSINPCVHAQRIQGNYRWTDPAGLNSMSLRFEGNSFKQINSTDMDSTLGLGTFIIQNKRLVLSYSNVQAVPISTYKIVSKKKLKTDNNSCFIDFNVVDKENNSTPFNGAFVLLKTDSISVAQVFADSLGNGNIIVWDTNLIHSISVGFIGYEWVVVHLNEFKNEQVTINFSIGIAKVKYFDKKILEYNIEGISNRHIKISHKGQFMVLKKDDRNQKAKKR